MSRTVRDAALENRTARSRLKPSGQPHYKALEPGLLSLGYRKPLTGAGKWLARRYLGNGAYQLHMVGVADDYSDADGTVILSYRQAQTKARELMVAEAGGGNGTVADAMADYLAHLEADGRSPDSVTRIRHTINAHILPSLGKVELANLTSEQLKRWCAELAKRPPRLRTKAGKAQVVRHGHRLAPGSMRRIWVALHAALQYAFDNDKVASDRPWRRLRPFRGADAVRARYLSMAEAKRLINAASPEFRLLLQAALLTGARYGQLCRLLVSDFNPDVGTLRLTSRKGRGHEKTHHAHLTEEGRKFFSRMCAGKSGSDLIFTHDNGRPWGRAHQLLPLKAASERAGIRPAVNFHMTRHTYASHAVMNGCPLLVVAKMLGHVGTKLVETTYGHLAPSYIANAIKEHAPRYGTALDNVRPLHGRK